MYELRVESDFAAAHFLREYEGKCENLHGHNWRIEVLLRGGKLDRAGMLVDFKHVKQVVAEVLERYDHKYLNELEEFKSQNPTTENISRIIYTAIGAKLPEGVSIHRVTCWESEKCAASYFED